MDEEEISAEYEEVEEISHSEYLAMHSNGIEIAEQENVAKDQLMLKKLLALEETLNNKCKKYGFKFNFKPQDFINYKMFDRWDFLSLADGKTVGSLKISQINSKVKFTYDIEHRWNVQEEDLHRWEILGNFAKFFQTPSIDKISRDTFQEVFDIKDSKVDLKELKNELRAIQEEKLENVINEYLKSGNHTLKFVEPKHIGEFRNFYGQADEVEFVEKPNKIRVQNKVQFYHAGTKKYYPVTAPKERLMNLLFDNWEG